MWYLQVDTLVFLLAATVLYALGAALLRKWLPGRRLTPALLALDLGLLLFVSPALAAFYAGYTLVSYGLLRLLGAARGQTLRRTLFVAFCLLDAAPFFFVRITALMPGFPAVLALVGFAYNMLKAMDGLFYVYYAEKEIPLLTYANFLLFYPVMTAGPILRYRDFEKYYLNPQPVTVETVERGVKRFIRGMFKKMVLVTLLGTVVTRLMEERLCLPVSLGLIVCSYFLLYLDLSGYSDIAIATASFTGIVVPENFKNPLTAASFTQFWRKWHVTLSDWIREHIFVVATGRRLSRPVGAAIGMGTMVVMSLWHEFSWLSLATGVYIGVFLVLENLFGWSTVDRRKTRRVVFVLRCVAVNFLFGINALSYLNGMGYEMGLGQIVDVVRGLFCL